MHTVLKRRPETTPRCSSCALVRGGREPISIPPRRFIRTIRSWSTPSRQSAGARASSRLMQSARPLAIGITCYPSIGGSGALACALGEELALRGHDVHFISYERPFRLPEELVRFHPVVINDYELFKYPDYTLPLSVRMAEV